MSQWPETDRAMSLSPAYENQHLKATLEQAKRIADSLEEIKGTEGQDDGLKVIVLNVPLPVSGGL